MAHTVLPGSLFITVIMAGFTRSQLLVQFYGQCAQAPSKATIWRVVTGADVTGVDVVIGAWLADQATARRTAERGPTHRAAPGRLATLVRQHWGIESLHWLRDTVYREDNSTVYTRSGPRVMAALRNFAIGAMRLTGRRDITRTTRSASCGPCGAA